jgi:hypothetical protein
MCYAQEVFFEDAGDIRLKCHQNNRPFMLTIQVTYQYRIVTKTIWLYEVCHSTIFADIYKQLKAIFEDLQSGCRPQQLLQNGEDVGLRMTATAVRLCARLDGQFDKYHSLECKILCEILGVSLGSGSRLFLSRYNF